MMRLILSTLAILVGLAAAPGAEQFRWEAGHGGDWDLHEHLADHIERAVERMADSAERLAHRVGHRLERTADRMAANLERDADRIRTRIEARVARIEARSVRRASGDGGGGGWIGQGAIDDDPCRDNDRWDNDDYRHCEVREERLPAGPLTVDAGRNGGIRVEGWDGADILIRAVVQANARDEADAKRLASGVEVRTGGGHVSASGPERGGSREWWSVSYRISVPRRTDLDLRANNGGITIANVAGTIRFDTTNGGVRLSDVGGAVNGRTRNGGVRIALGGTAWDGAGLDVETSNGGVTLAIPETYNAQLETRTANGGFRFDYPLTLTGELSPRRGISTTIGAGGAPVRVRTTNGGLRIERRGASAR